MLILANSFSKLAGVPWELRIRLPILIRVQLAESGLERKCFRAMEVHWWFQLNIIVKC